MFTFKEKISGVLITLIAIGLFVTPIKAKAFPVYDAQLITTNANLTAIQTLMGGTVAGTPLTGQPLVKAGKIIIRRMLREMTNSIVTWVEGDFKNPDGTKSPAFITNTEEFFQDAADIAIGDLLLNSELDFLCDPFKIQVKLALGLQYRPFKEDIKCTFTSALGNATSSLMINNFLAGDFINGGGWDSFLKLTTVPQNNQMGAMIIAQNELQARITTSKETKGKELDWGSGFMSWKECPETTTVYSAEGVDVATNARDDIRLDTYAKLYAGGVRDDKGCVIKTPGREIVDWFNISNTSVVRELELADNLDAIFNAFADLALRKTMEKVSGAFVTKPAGSTQAEKNIAELARLEAEYNQTTFGSSGGNNSLYNNTTGGANFSSQSFVNKTVALETINTHIGIETNFLNAQANLYQMLETTNNIFASSTCSTTVKETVSNQITGNFTGVKDLPWNMIDISTVSGITTSNITTLTTTRASVEATTNDAAVPSLVRNLTTLNTIHSVESVTSVSTGGTAFTNLKNWIIGKLNNNRACVGDISALSPWGIQ